MTMIRTRGMAHIGLTIRDVERSVRFYKRVFGVKEIFREEGHVQVQTPGCQDVIALEQGKARAGKVGGVTHFGFRLVDPLDIDAAVREVEHTSGKILRRGEFVPGEPYVFAADPDGYEVEIWYE